jgi:glycosyltransferase involved in cell wall biosynthesis
MKEGYIKRENRKKILLLTDDIRVHSGVAHIAREMVIHTSHRYNWVQLAGAINHPEKGKRLDLSEDTGKMNGIEDASVVLYPTDGYGNPDLVRQIMEMEKIDAIFLITDPRYFTWLFQIENEIRKKIPIAYLNIWDDYPAPMYNKEFYESCDALFGISKQTVNINEIVLGNKAKSKVIKYVPHGLNEHTFKPVDPKNEELAKFKKQILGNEEYEFVLLFNSRNIRRKSIPDTILAWRLFCDQIGEEKAKKCLLLLHTDPVDDNGTDLPAVIEYLCPEEYCNVKFTNGKFDGNGMNFLYNIADGVILLTSNEGWGLALTEALLSGTPIIANVTGGMQDQMRFIDADGKWFTPSPEIPSNHRGTFGLCGKWALPVFPSNMSLVGSVPTPYIFDDRCRPEDATEQILNLYNMSKEERQENGLAGREWAIGDEAGFTSAKMSNRIIEGMDELFSTWEPREKYEFLKDTDFEPRTLKHALIY